MKEFILLCLIFILVYTYLEIHDSSKNDSPTVPKQKKDLRMTYVIPGDDSWRFIVMADIHSMGWFSWKKSYLNRFEENYQKQLAVVRHIKQNYGGELVAMPGDAASYGPLSLTKIIELVGGNHSPSTAVYIAGFNAFTTARAIFKDAGYDTILATVGDHELGGNEGFKHNGMKDTKLGTIPSARQAFGDGFNRDTDNKFLFDQPWFDDVGSRPLGTIYENTSFAYIHKNTLFVTVDAFELVGDGTQDYIDLKHGLGGKGAVACTVDGEHLAWFDNVLRKGRDDPSIKHMIVQAHQPIIQPVRKISTTGQFFDRGEESEFWALMNTYGVDIYFAGEAHANTVTKTRNEGSNLIQIVSRGNYYNNFLTVDIRDDIINVRIHNEIGSKKSWNGQYEEAGHLIIDKTSSYNTNISSSGLLKVLDLNAPLLFFHFDEILPLGKRQVLGFHGDDSLIANEVTIRNELCTKSMPNLGGFGAQYDAQVGNIALVQGWDGGGAGYFTRESRMALSSTGPFSAGEAISFGLWIKTDQSDRKMVLVHHGNYWGKMLYADQKDHFTLSLDKGIPSIRTRPGTKVTIESRNITDNQWHHIAVSMPRNSCLVSELEIYIDGESIDIKITTKDHNLFHTTTGRMSIGGFGYSNSGFESAYPNLKPYIGLLDDFYLFGRPLNIDEDFSGFSPV